MTHQKHNEFEERVKNTLTEWMINNNDIAYNGLHTILAPKILSLIEEAIREAREEGKDEGWNAGWTEGYAEGVDSMV